MTARLNLVGRLLDRLFLGPRFGMRELDDLVRYRSLMRQHACWSEGVESDPASLLEETLDYYEPLHRFIRRARAVEGHWPRRAEAEAAWSAALERRDRVADMRAEP